MENELAKEFLAVIKEMKEQLVNLTTEQAAQRELVAAIAETHQNPKALLDSFYARMDQTALTMKPELIPLFRGNLQHWESLLVQLASRKQS